MADARENLQEGRRRRRSNEIESRSIEETNEPNPDMWPIRSGRSSYERNDWGYERDSRSWAENREYENLGRRGNDAGRIPYQIEEPYADIRLNRQQQRLRDAEMQQRRSHETESSAMPLKKREYEYSGLRYNEPVQIRDHNESYIRDNIQQQRVRDSEMQQWRSHETESRFEQQRVGDYEMQQWRSHETESRFEQQRVGDYEMQQWRNHETESRFEQQRVRDSEMQQWRSHETEPRFQQQRVRDSEMQQRRSHETESRFQQQMRDWSESRRIFDEMTQMAYETEQSSVYPKRPRIKDCHFYLQNGWCGFGSECIYNHPGSPMRQARTMDDRARGSTWGLHEEGYETERMVTKTECDVIRDTRDRGPRQMIQRRYGNDWVVNLERQYNRTLPEIIDEIVSGHLLKEERQRENTERQRREAQEAAEERRRRDTNLRQRRFEQRMREAREQRLMEIPVVNHNVDNHQEQRQRENIEWQRRETRENVEEHTQRDIEMERRKDEESFNHLTQAAKLDEQRQRDIERQNREAEDGVEQQKETETQENLAEQRQGDIEIQKGEAEESVDEQVLEGRELEKVDDHDETS